MIGLLASTAGVGGAPTASPAPAIDVVASNWAFTPATVTLHVGTPAALRFTSKEGVHGVASEALDIPKTTLVPGKTVSIVVTPKKAGVYTVPCSIVCGAGHAAMKLTVDVQP